MTQPAGLRYTRRVMPGRLDVKQLAQQVRRGEIDTVLIVFPDTFGRLLGKRVVGRYFVDHVAREGSHACIYLFTVDMEMEPLPGFALTSWERGYGDMRLVPRRSGASRGCRRPRSSSATSTRRRARRSRRRRAGCCAARSSAPRRADSR
jgi:hypothetical protein